METVKRINDLVGKIKEVSLDEMGWLLYVHGISMVYCKEGKIFVFKMLSDIVKEYEVNENTPVTILQSFMDVVYTKYTEDGMQYVEYNTRKNKTHLTKGVPDAVSERDECFYASLMPIGTYYSDMVYEYIMKEGKGKVKK